MPLGAIALLSQCLGTLCRTLLFGRISIHTHLSLNPLQAKPVPLALFGMCDLPNQRTVVHCGIFNSADLPGSARAPISFLCRSISKQRLINAKRCSGEPFLLQVGTRECAVISVCRNMTLHSCLER